MPSYTLRGALGLCAVLCLISPLPAAASPTAAGTIAALGEVCYLAGTQEWCFPLEVTFDPAGGPVAGTTQGTAEIPVPAAGVSFVSTFQATFEGTFEGGDGGKVAGTWQSTSQLKVPSGFSIPPNMGVANGTASGAWEGVLQASGTGKGTLTGSDSGGNPANGTWTLRYSADSFRSGLTQPSPTAAPPTALPATGRPPTATVAPVATLPPGAMPDSPAVLATAVDQEQTALLSPNRSDLPPVLAPWYFGQVVRMAIAEDEILAMDIFGQSAPITAADAALTSLSSEVIYSNPGFDWCATLTGLGMRTFDAVRGMGSSSFQFVTGTLEVLMPSETASDFLTLLTTPPDLGDAPLSETQAATLQGEVLLHTLQSQADHDQVDPAEGGEPAEPVEQLATLVDQQREEDRRHYVDLLNEISQEEWDQLVDDGFDPAEVVRSRRSMNRALQAMRARLGEEQLSQIELQFKLDAAAAGSLRERLLYLGATPEKADELARAAGALRVLTALAEEHTVSTGGLLSGLTRFIDAWIVRAQAQSLAIDAAGTNLQGLSETQLALIQSADRRGLIDALTAESELSDDPVLRLILEQVQGGR